MYSNNSHDPNHDDNHRFSEYQQGPRRDFYQENQYTPGMDTENPSYKDSFRMESDLKSPDHENAHNDQRLYDENNQSPQDLSDHQNNPYPYQQEDNQSPQNRFQSPSDKGSHDPFSKQQREISNSFKHPNQENHQNAHREQRRKNDSFELKTDIKDPYHESQLASQRSQNHYQYPNNNNFEPQKSRRDSSKVTGYFKRPPKKSYRPRDNTLHNNDPVEYFEVNSPHEQETPSPHFHKNQPTIEVNTPDENDENLKRKYSFEVTTHFKPETEIHNRNDESSGISFPNFIHHLPVQSLQDQSGQPNPLSLQSPALNLNDILNFDQEFQEIETEKRNILPTYYQDLQAFSAKNNPVPTTTEAILKNSPLPLQFESPKQSPREPAKFETKNFPERSLKIYLVLIFIYIILGLALTLALMVYHFDKNKIDFTPISGALQYISFNLNAAPIMQLQLVDKGSSCPTGLSPLSIGTWSGTVWGCNCPNTLKREVCSYSESKSCSLVFPYSERNLYDWRESLWCGRRAEIGTELVKKKTCPTGYMQCSPGICVVNTGSCPITSISVSSKTSSNLFGDSSGKYLTVKSTLGEDPLIDITISPNSIPCFSDGYYNTGDTETYILLRDRETGCSKYGLDSEESTKIDEKTQYDVFSVDNSFSVTLFNLLVGYKDITQNTNAVLSSRKRISVTNNDACLTLDSEKFQAPISSYNNLRKTLNVTSIIAISLLGTFILVLLGLVIHLRRSMRKLPLLEALKQKRAKGLLLFASVFATLGVAIYTVMFILIAIHRSGMMETYEDSKALKDDCFSGKPALVLQDYQDFVDTIIKKIYRLALALLIIAWTTLTPALILLYKHIFFS